MTNRSSRYASRTTWIVGIFVFLLFNLIGFGLVIGLGLTQPDTSAANTEPSLMQVTDEILAVQDTFLSVPAGDISVFVPAEALDQDGSIKLTPLDPDLFPEAGPEPGWSRPKTVNVEYFDVNGSLQPEVVFSQALEVCFVLDENGWGEYLHLPATFTVEYYDQSVEPAQWVRMPVLAHAEQQQLCGQASGPALFALSVKEPPDQSPSQGEPYSP